jgi:hypothetical protein
MPHAGRNELLALLSVLMLAPGCQRGAQQKPRAVISFTQVPESNPGDHDQQDVIEGKVSAARPGQRMVVYAKCGELWWLQPLLTSPFTMIWSGGVWRNETHLGTAYAALLVDASYHPAACLRRVPDAGGNVIAVGVTPGQEKSSSFFTSFSGFTWRIRRMPSDRGGTVNAYDPRNVYVDQAGALHLRIMQRDQQWSCSELNLTRSLGYGTYSFTVEDTSKLDPAVIFGMFMWDYSMNQESSHEFDIEIGRWGEPDRQNAQFVLQPNYAVTNLSRFTAPAGTLKYTIVWEPGSLTMTASRPIPGEPVVSKHRFTSEVPGPGSESMRMALFYYWNGKGTPTRLQQPAEVVVDRFQFLP